MMASFRALRLSSKDQDSQILITIKERLEGNITTLEKEGDWFQSLLAKIALAETEIGLENSELALVLAKQVLETAEVYGASDMIERAQSVIEGKTVFDLVELANEPKKLDEHLMELSDEEIPMYARQLAQVLGIPNERLSNLEIEYRWLRKDAFERQTHCRYINVKQDLRHSRHLETTYIVNPDRRYECIHYGHISRIIGTDRDNLLINFKDNFCLGCTQKRPIDISN